MGNIPKRTPLSQEHEALGAKMVDFAGWWMPVEYQGLRQEHLNVRENVGLFDVSHMGEIRVQGPKSLALLENITTNDVARLKAGEAQYSLLPNEQGGVVDDIIVYCLEPGADYLVCVNASNTEKDWQWFQGHANGATLKNESADWAQIAVQGPKALSLLSEIFGNIATLKSFQFARTQFAGVEAIVARTGYTGEDGAEIFIRPAGAVELWRTLLNKGRSYGAAPIGLGARDTLRTEMKFPLYGHELSDTSNPYAAGLGWVVKPQKKDFIGKEVILAAREKGLPEKLVGFIMRDRGIPRAGYTVVSESGEKLGSVTSGTPSPSLNKNVGVAYIKAEMAKPGVSIWIDIRGRKVAAEVVNTPFVKK